MVAKSGFNVEVNVEVGSNSEHRQAVYIPAAARRVNPVLRRALSDRAIVTNTDATSLEAALQYIQQYRFLRRLQRNPLAKLATGSNMALNVAKAWHLAQMLELPRMQNKLIDTFSSCFRLLLEAPTHTPFSPEPFEYLRTHTGYYTNCEKFIVEFYAGLASHREPLCPKDLASLPGDIAQELQHRCTEMVASSTPYTRIEQGSKIYGVSSADRTWKDFDTACLCRVSYNKPAGTVEQDQASVLLLPSNFPGLVAKSLIATRNRRFAKISPKYIEAHTAPILAGPSAPPPR
jgi:hypothetical protein